MDHLILVRKIRVKNKNIGSLVKKALNLFDITGGGRFLQSNASPSFPISSSRTPIVPDIKSMLNTSPATSVHFGGNVYFYVCRLGSLFSIHF